MPQSNEFDGIQLLLDGKRLAVDLTPMLPEGDNGGVKWMTLELLRALAGLLPRTNFVLLTAESSHPELAQLEIDCPNVHRICVFYGIQPTFPAPKVSAAIPARGKRLLRRARSLVGRVLPALYRQRVRQWLRHGRFTEGSGVLPPQAGFDLLFCPFTTPNYAVAHRPTVSVIVDLQYRAYPQFFTPEEVSQRGDAFRSACQKADFLVVISEFVRQTVIGAAGMPPERVVTVPIGLLRPPAHPSDGLVGNAFLEQRGLRAGEYLLYPANFWPHKNHSTLLTAFGAYCAANPRSTLKLVCTGSPGVGAEAFCEAARRMRLTNRVLYLGFVPLEEYQHLLISAFALVFPSLYEGFGIPVLEAMAAGVPVLCSNVTSLPEVGGAAVLYFDPQEPSQIADAVRRLAAEPGLREKLIARGRLQSAQFAGPDRMARGYALVFAKALDPSSLASTHRIHGVYADGWTGGLIEVHFPPGDPSVPRALLLNLENPSWRRHAVQVRYGMQTVGEIESTRVPAGASTQLRVSLPPAHGVVNINLSPTFSPSTEGMNADDRELALLCNRCEIMDSRGVIIPFLGD